jgi:hypothetical protein
MIERRVCETGAFDHRTFERPAEWDEGESECPPGPILSLVGLPCDDDAYFITEVCSFPGRRYTGWAQTSINRTSLHCYEGRSVIFMTSICCDEPLLTCPSGAEEGASCASAPLGECVVPGPDADLADGYVNGQICACDEPGPKWRCAPLCQLCDGYGLTPEVPWQVDCGLSNDPLNLGGNGGATGAAGAAN